MSFDVTQGPMEKVAGTPSKALLVSLCPLLCVYVCVCAHTAHTHTHTQCLPGYWTINLQFCVFVLFWFVYVFLSGVSQILSCVEPPQNVSHWMTPGTKNATVTPTKVLSLHLQCCKAEHEWSLWHRPYPCDQSSQFLCPHLKWTMENVGEGAWGPAALWESS